jgi:hypothetical protein
MVKQKVTIVLSAFTNERVQVAGMPCMGRANTAVVTIISSSGGTHRLAKTEIDVARKVGNCLVQNNIVESRAQRTDPAFF